MNKTNSIISKIKWISFISKRFSRIDRKGRSSVTSKLATAGICFGVMTLIVVMSIMNGFQMSFIDAIMEISSYHVRVTEVSQEKETDFYKICKENKNVLSVTPFYEAQTLMTGKRGRESAAIIRAIEPNVYLEDKGFYQQLKMINGSFNLSGGDTIVLGSSLARKLNVSVGDTVNLLVLSGGTDVSLFSDDRYLKVTGIFTTGYSEINSAYSFISLSDGEKYFGENARKIFGIKLNIDF